MEQLLKLDKRGSSVKTFDSFILLLETCIINAVNNIVSMTCARFSTLCISLIKHLYTPACAALCISGFVAAAVECLGFLCHFSFY